MPSEDPTESHCMNLDDAQPTTVDRDRVLRAAVLIEPTKLARAIAAGRSPVVIAVRAPDVEPTGPSDRLPRIPGALDAHLASDFAGPGGGLAGSRPLPTVESLQESVRRLGLRADSAVVVYDHDGGLQAARAWWVLRWAGLAEVRLLDGGFAAWTAASLPTTREIVDPSPGDLVVRAGQMPELDADGAQRLARDGLLLDSRIAPNYEGGETASGEAPRGHVPGAINLPAAANLDTSGRFLDAVRLRDLYASIGVDGTRPVGLYCGAGVSAAHDLIALASIGIDAPMYVGSWSAWSADPSRPVARGRAPG